jgi:hypothetical protein
VGQTIPQVEGALGVAFPYDYLHVELDVDFEADLRGQARGVNIYLSPPAVTNRGTITHELVHVFQSVMSPTGGPAWFIEGLADVIRVRLTGDRSTAYIAGANGGKVHLDARRLVFASDKAFQSEGGNGFQLLSAVQDLIGYEAFANGSREALAPRTGLAAGQDILAAYERHTPPEKLDALRRLYMSRVDGYTP